MKWLSNLACLIGLLLFLTDLGAGLGKEDTQGKDAATELSNLPLIYKDAVVAIVGEEIITRFDVLIETHLLELRRIQQYTEEQLKDPKIRELIMKQNLELRKELASLLIDREVIYYELQKQNVHLPEGIIEERIEKMINNFAQGDRIRFERSLLEKGITWELFKKQLRKQIMVDFYIHQYLDNTLRISPQEIHEYYQRNLSEFQTPAQVKLIMFYFFFSKGFQEVELDPVATRIRQWLSDRYPLFVQSQVDEKQIVEQFKETFSDVNLKITFLSWQKEKDLSVKVQQMIEEMECQGELKVSPFVWDQGWQQGWCFAILERKPMTIIPILQIYSQIETKLQEEQLRLRQKDYLAHLKRKLYIKTYF